MLLITAPDTTLRQLIDKRCIINWRKVQWTTRTVLWYLFFFFQAEDGIRDVAVTGVQTCALPISPSDAAGTAPGRPRDAAPPPAVAPPNCRPWRRSRAAPGAAACRGRRPIRRR